MKLLTLNCHSWQEEDQIEKIKYLAVTIKDRQYDVVALQEVSQRIDTQIVNDNIRKDNFAYLLIKELEKLNVYDYSFIWDTSHIGYDIYEEGLAILTKHKITEAESFYISKSHDMNNYKSRKIIKATIDIEDEEVDFYSCHLGWWKDEVESFTYQADNLTKKVYESNNRAIIMGDFNNNAFVRNEGYDYLLSRGLKDTYNLAREKDNGITVCGEIAGWEQSKEEKRLDLILTSKDILIKTSKVIFNNLNKDIISDHFGVEIEL